MEGKTSTVQYQAANKAQLAKVGQCPLCGRNTALTFHHLIPKKMHRRTFFKKNFDKATLAKGIAICRGCHNGIHRFYSEMELAKRFNSLELLLADEVLRQHFKWVAKQRVKVPSKV